MKVLITGANGFVGSYVARACLKQGWTVKVLIREHADMQLLAGVEHLLEIHYGDLFDITAIADAMRGAETVVHTAAMVSFWPPRMADMHQVNVIGTRNMVDVAMAQGIRHFVHISSIAALGRSAPESVCNETNTWTESELNTPYALSKQLAEREVYRAMAEGLPATLLLPSVVLGPGNWKNGSTALFKQIWNGPPLSPPSVLNYVDVRDVADVVTACLQKVPSNDRFIVHGGHVPYIEFMTKSAQLLGKPTRYQIVSPMLAALAWRWEAVKAFFTRHEPLLTRQTAHQAMHTFYYDNTKIMQHTGLSFRSLDDTLKYTCEGLAQKYGLEGSK